MNSRHSLALIIAVLMLGCSPSTPETPATAASGPREADGALTRAHAEERAARVSEVSYGLEITLDPALDHFAGSVEIAFQLSDTERELTVDFVEGEIANLIVNGTAVNDAYNGYFVTLPAANLVKGSNTVSMDYTHPWSNDGSGLYRYDDKEDGNVYVYTDLEHYDAHRWLPHFDQPDIKATFAYTVHAPAGWHVISTKRETSIEAGAVEGMKTWTFPPSPVMSSYIISLHAGPYAMWEDADFRYPLRIFARQALAKYMDEEVWFEATRGSFDVLDAYYDLPYPYEKYDQIVVPDFNAGAMENIAAVTFNESYIERDGRDRDEHLRLTSVIAHEMAHMWFGDLVTMRWWNGLWLNESFASYMGTFAADSLGFDEAWDEFGLRGKTGAYRTDASITTHAVETPVENTDEVYDNFDAISYSKGASTLRQVAFLIGEEKFRDGIRIYLARHRDGNTSLEDFIDALGEAAGQDLTEWGKEWLYTPGVNTIQAEYSCSDGLVSAFALTQAAPADYPVLRTQRVQVGLYNESNGVVKTSHVIPVTYTGARTEVSEAVGKPCPTLVFPNHGDYGYVVVDLDPQARENLAANIAGLEDSYQRVMFWGTLFESTRAGTIPVTEYLDVVLSSAGDETNRTAIKKIYRDAGSVLDYLLMMGDDGSDAFANYAPRVEHLIWQRVKSAKGDEVTLLFDLYRAAAVSDEGVARLVALLDGKASVPGLVIDQDRRWEILQTMSGNGWNDVRQRAEAELERDKSARARRRMLAIDVAYPDAENKAKYLDDLFDPESKMSYADQRTVARALFNVKQMSIHEQYADRIIKQIAATEAESDPAYFNRARLIAGSLIPAACTDASVARLAAMVEAHKGSRDSVRRSVIESWEDDVRCVARKSALAKRGEAGWKG